MDIIYLVTAILILLYFIYPLWLMILPARPFDISDSEDIDGVTMVLLSYNGKEFLNDKIGLILKELSGFSHYELLVIDDNSSDGSQELLKRYKVPGNIRIIMKDKRRGIPHTMNLAVDTAAYECIVFCDQRQNLSENAIHLLTEPLKQREIAAVSGCMSCFDKQECKSLIRKYENYVKLKESQKGNLIGVYGPLYAIKKRYYVRIPENIILDDLYLSLMIIKTGQIRLAENCQFTDDGLSVFYNYKRAKRYLHGFLQILNDKKLLSKLSIQQIIMLLWHKYFRLLIPVFLFISYVFTGIRGIHSIEYLIVFLALTLAGSLSFIPALGRINLLYLLAMSDIFFYEICCKRFLNINRKP